jgi:hypothetical protein
VGSVVDTYHRVGEVVRALYINQSITHSIATLFVVDMALVLCSYTLILCLEVELGLLLM